MATIIIKNSTGSGVVPSSLVQGELAINTKDGKLYYGSGSGNVVKEFTGSGGSSTSTFPYTGSAIISGSLTVTGSFYVSNSIDSNNRYLYNAAGNIPLNWQDQLLYDAINVTSVRWNDRILDDQSGVSSINWDTRRLQDSSGNISTSWEDRILANNASTTTLNWQDEILYDSTGTTSIDWERRILKDTLDNISAEYEDRRLISNDGATVALNWSAPGTILLSGSLIPAGPYTNNTSSYDLGSATAAWRDLYVSNGSIKLISGSQSASISFTSGSLNFGTTPISSPNVLTTASVSSNTITFTKGDGSTFPITVNTGSGGGGGGTDLGLTYAISIGYFMP